MRPLSESIQGDGRKEDGEIASALGKDFPLQYSHLQQEVAPTAALCMSCPLNLARRPIAPRQGVLDMLQLHLLSIHGTPRDWI